MERKQYVRPIAEVMNIETESLMIQASVKAIQSSEGFIFGGGGSVPNRTRSHSRDTWSSGWEV